MERDLSDPAYGFTPGEQHLLRTHGDTSVLEREQNAPREAEEFHRRQRYDEYRADAEHRQQLERENLALREQIARKDERLNVINDAMTPDPDPEAVAAQNVEYMYDNIAPPPFGTVPEDSGYAYWRDRYNRAQMGRLQAQVNQMQTTHAINGAVDQYKQAAWAHEQQHPGYVQHIYGPFLRSRAMEIRHLQPNISNQELYAQLMREEAQLVGDARRQGIDPHVKIHTMANMRGIYSPAEIQRGRDAAERERAEARAAAEHAAREADKQEREAVRLAIIQIPISGRNGLLEDPRYRKLKDLARKHKLPPFNGTGMTTSY
jgi:hypothetical protein